MRRILILVVVLVLPSSAMAIELAANGDFEVDLSLGWKMETLGSATSFSRDTTYDGDPDTEVLVEKGTGNGHALLNQTVVVPSTDVSFSVHARIEVSSTSGPWAAAGVALHYESAVGDVLGTTMIVGRTVDCPWIDSDSFHMIPAPDGEWNLYAFNVADELINLPGVDMMAVHQIRISLYGQVGGDC
jgi:hypothetical protein